jgi:hypothetical protein
MPNDVKFVSGNARLGQSVQLRPCHESLDPARRVELPVSSLSKDRLRRVVRARYTTSSSHHPPSGCAGASSAQRSRRIKRRAGATGPHTVTVATWTPDGPYVRASIDVGARTPALPSERLTRCGSGWADRR